jgi:hypothetical protein
MKKIPILFCLLIMSALGFAQNNTVYMTEANNGQHFTWDCVLLGLFWICNAISEVIFHFSWKMHFDVWDRINSPGVATQGKRENFVHSSITTAVWFLMRTTITNNSILWCFTICIWFFFACAFCIGNCLILHEVGWWLGGFEKDYSI